METSRNKTAEKTNEAMLFKFDGSKKTVIKINRRMHPYSVLSDKNALRLAFIFNLTYQMS